MSTTKSIVDGAGKNALDGALRRIHDPKMFSDPLVASSDNYTDNYHDAHGDDPYVDIPGEFHKDVPIAVKN